MLDPMCGSGTIPIEAAMIGLNMAPGLKRQFVSEEWPFMPKSLWDKARQEAEDAIDRAADFRILASDIDGRVLRTARNNAEQAGVADYIAFQTLPLNEISSKKKYGCIITNPPYGERLGEQREAEALYREMGKVCEKLDTWSFYVLTSHKSFEDFWPKGRQKTETIQRKNSGGLLSILWAPSPVGKLFNSYFFVNNNIYGNILLNVKMVENTIKNYNSMKESRHCCRIDY